MTTLVVDWLGRGGIAQMSGTILQVLREAGHATVLITRPGRELTERGGGIATVVRTNRGGRVQAHHGVVNAALRALDEQRPEVMVVQNYVLPLLEQRVLRRARERGVRTVLVVHDGRLHSRLAGTGLGLPGLVALADEVVVHSRFVADQVVTLSRGATRPIVVPLGPFRSVADVEPERPAGLPDGRLATTFGVLKRRYKGGDLVEAVAAAAPEGWRVVAAGVGARPAPGLHAVPGFLDASVLAGVVQASTCTLLPYRYATQSGAVVLSQALGAVPIASAVGGLPEQIEHGVTGLLLPPGASVASWIEAIESCAIEDFRARIVAAARAKIASDHVAFSAWARALA